MAARHRQKSVLNRVTLADLIHVSAYDAGARCFAIAHDTNMPANLGFDLGAMWIGLPINGLNDQLFSTLQEMLSQEMPDDTTIQIQRFASSNIKGYIEAYLGAKKEALRASVNSGLTAEQKKLLRHQVEATAKFIEAGANESVLKDSSTLLKDHIVLVSIRIPFKRQPSRKQVGGAEKLFERTGAMLQKLNLLPHRADATQYLNVMSSLLRPNERPRAAYDAGRPINEQVGSGEDLIQIHDKWVDVNGHAVQSMSCEMYPPQHNWGKMMDLFGDSWGTDRQIDDPYLVTLTLVFPNQIKAQDRVMADRLKADHFNKNLVRKFSSRARNLAQSMEEFSESISGQNQVVHSWFSFATFSKDSDSAEDSSQAFKSMARAYGFDFRRNDFMQGTCFLQMLPLAADPRLMTDIGKYQRKTTEQAAHLVPILGDWSGNASSPMRLYVSRRSTLISFNSWASSSGYNRIIAAETGAGKSFMVQDDALNQLAQGVKVAMIDKGRSFEKFVKDHKGTYYDFSDPGEWNLNPFVQVQDIDEESEALTVLFATMAAPDGHLSEFQEAELAKSIRRGWAQNGAECSIDWLVADLDRHPDRRVKDIAAMLEAYGSQGQHGRWMDGGQPLTFGSNMLVSLEIGTLDGKPKLQAVVLQMVLMELQRLMYMEDSRGKDGAGDAVRLSVIIDEAAPLLKQRGPARFVEVAYRQARKHGGSVTTVFQSISDLEELPDGIGKVLYQNAAFRLLLRQKAEALNWVEQSGWLDLDDYSKQMLRTVRTVQGQYSEIFFCTPHGNGIGRLVASREQQLLFTTDDKEKALLKRYTDKDLSIQDAIAAVVRDEKKSTGEQQQESVVGKGRDRHKAA